MLPLIRRLRIDGWTVRLSRVRLQRQLCENCSQDARSSAYTHANLNWNQWHVSTSARVQTERQMLLRLLKNTVTISFCVSVCVFHSFLECVCECVWVSVRCWKLNMQIPCRFFSPFFKWLEVFTSNFSHTPSAEKYWKRFKRSKTSYSSRPCVCVLDL